MNRVIVLCLIFFGIVPLSGHTMVPKTKTVLLGPTEVPAHTLNMVGPTVIQKMPLTATKNNPLWITGMTLTTYVNDNEVENNKFVCHGGLRFQSKNKHHHHHHGHSTHTGRMVAINMNTPNRELKFPQGFGLPIQSNAEQHELNTYWVYSNPTAKPISIKAKLQVDYLHNNEARQQDYRALKGSMAAMLLSQIKAKKGAVAPQDQVAVNSHRHGSDKYNDSWWGVPPGRHTYRADITKQLQKGFDYKIHFARQHLHPHGQSIAIVDKTLGKVLVESKRESAQGPIGNFTVFSSTEGVSIHKHHEYELKVEYHNQSKKVVDAMAALIFYWAPVEIDKKNQASIGR